MKTLSLDSLLNFVSGIGTAKDKNIHTQYAMSLLTREQLETAYRGDWIARKVVDIPPQDMTRGWRAWQADDKQIEAIENEEKRLGLRAKVKSALIKARLYGGSGLVLGVGTEDPITPLDVRRVKQGDLRYVHPVTRHEVVAQTLNYDVTSEFYGQPTSYLVQPVNKPPTYVHPSRIVRFLGNELPAVTLSTDGWGDSVLQALDSAVKNAGMAADGIAGLLQEAKVDVISIPNLMANISTKEYKDRLTERLTLANTAKSILNTLLLDKEEKWERITTNFGTLDAIMHVYLVIASGASDIPTTRFLGQSARGMNATGEGDARNYFDRISSDQETMLRPTMEPLDNVLLASALGTYDPKIHYEWSSLWQMTEPERAKTAADKAAVFKIDSDSGLIDPHVLTTARLNQLVEDGVYPGLEAAIEESETLGIDETSIEARQQFALSKGGTVDPATGKPIAKTGPDGQPANENIRQAADGSWRDPTGLAYVLDWNVDDAEPRTLYVRREVLNKSDILTWARKWFQDPLVEDMHVTIIYSRAKVDWMKAGSNDWGQEPDGTLKIAPGGPRLVDLFGPPGAEDTAVLMFSSSQLCYRNCAIREATGASFDYDEYQPHVSIKKNPGIDLEKVEPYRGPILLGPEIFEEVRT